MGCHQIFLQAASAAFPEGLLARLFTTGKACRKFCSAFQRAYLDSGFSQHCAKAKHQEAR
jgi:hypothetical protein